MSGVEVGGDQLDAMIEQLSRLLSIIHASQASLPKLSSQISRW